MTSIAQWLQSKLHELDWTQADLSRRSGVSTTNLNKLFRSQQRLTPETAERLAAVPELSVTAIELLRIAGELTQPNETELGKQLGIFGAIYARLSRESQQMVNELMTTLLRREERQRGKKK